MICFKDCKYKIDQLHEENEDLRDNCASIMRLKNNTDQQLIDLTCKWKCDRGELLKQIEELKKQLDECDVDAVQFIFEAAEESKKKPAPKHKSFTKRNLSSIKAE